MGKEEKIFTLREKKYAKTKIALTNAFIERLKTTRFNDISIKEVCESVEVSEGTFFNYFPQKIDVVLFFKQVTSLKISYYVKQNAEKMTSKELILMIFDNLAKEIEQPYLFYEIISLFTSEKKKPQEIELEPAEKFYSNPETGGIETIPIQSMEEIFLSVLKEAKKRDEIKKEAKLDDVVLMLMTILIGVPLAIDIEDFGKLKGYFRAQFALLWSAVGA